MTERKGQSKAPAPRAFDPWPFVDGSTSAEHSQLTDLQRLQIGFAADLEVHRPVTGFEVLQAIVACAGNDIPVPGWLAIEMQRRLQAVAQYRVGSLDDPEAFGPVPLRSQGEHLNTARLRNRWAFILESAFAPYGKLPRTKSGYEKAASILTGNELSPKQVESLLPKTRENEPAHQHNDAQRLTGAPAHDPFALTKHLAVKPGSKK